MAKKNSRSSNPKIVMEADDGASNDSSDVDIYIDEPTELPPPLPSPAPQQNASRSKGGPKRANVTTSFETEWNDADHERQYDLTPLGEKNTNRRSAPSYSIDPWENARAKEIALAGKLEKPAVDKEGYVDRRLPRLWLLLLLLLFHLLQSSHAVTLPILAFQLSIVN
jgi:hypothetical protein